jgi:glycolate oxidase iron-sulfur subunit
MDELSTSAPLRERRGRIFAALLLDRKIKRIFATKATVVATANPGCHLQIANGLAQLDAPVHVRHPVSLLAEAYRREETRNQSSKGV